MEQSGVASSWANSVYSLIGKSTGVVDLFYLIFF